MAIDIGIREPVTKEAPKRYASLDFARGIAIMLMLFVHVIHACLDIEYLMSDAVLGTQPLAALMVPVFIPFIGGLAGFFLLISATSNMISMYRDLENGKTIRSVVFKQIFGGFLLLVFAMLCEGLIGYWGLVGDFFLNLNNPANTNWGLMMWRWNHFETIHSIAWCLIINGCLQGLLSLNERWKNKRNLIVTYGFMAIIIVAFTDTVWTGVGNILPGYPFADFPSGNGLMYPWIGTESFWEILRTPFLAVLASTIEPLFPYLAVSFIGSIIGIVLSKPKDEIDKSFPKKMLRIGGSMYGIGVAGIFVTLFLILKRNGYDIVYTINFYLTIIYHRYWTPDNPMFNGVPQLAWLAQFLAVTGMSIMLLMLLLRLVEFRGVSEKFANKTKIVRRFGTIAFTNYNNQWLFFIMWEIVSLMVSRDHYIPQLWAATALIIILTFGIFILLNWLWEKIGYIGSLEWSIRSITNNAIPIRRERINDTAYLRAPNPDSFDDLKTGSENKNLNFRIWLRKIKLRLQGKAVDNKLKWWQRGQIDVKNYFYKAKWIDIVDKKDPSVKSEYTIELTDSKISQVMGIIGLCTIFLFPCSIFGLIFAIKSRKNEGINKQNTVGLILSIITIVLFTGLTIALFVIKAGVLGL